MTTATVNELVRKRCAPCEGGVPKFSRQQAEEQLRELPDWHLSDDAARIRREWQAKDFIAAIEFFNRVAAMAETEHHHPDLHLDDYRHVRVELSTHAIGGLSENDFILAAKIEKLSAAMPQRP